MTVFAGKQEGQEPSASAQSTASKLSQQVSSQRADFIASHTPTSLNKAHKVSHAKKQQRCTINTKNLYSIRLDTYMMTWQGPGKLAHH